jgi:hypothetical protein
MPQERGAGAPARAGDIEGRAPMTGPAARITTDAEWTDTLEVPIEASRPHIPPQDYLARSVGTDTFERRGWGRRLVLWFDVYAGDPLIDDPRILARLPLYCRLPNGGRPIKATSKLGRVLQFVEPRRGRLSRVSLRALKHRLWVVRVRDVRTGVSPGGGQRPLAPPQVYSVIDDVLEHRA